MQTIEALFQDELITLLYDEKTGKFYHPSNMSRAYYADELFMMHVILPSQFDC